MNMPVWFSNLIFWSAQVALLTLAAGFLPYIFQIRQPRVLLVYWRALIGISLLLPFAQPWHRTQNFVPITIAPGVAGSIPNSSPIPTSIPAETHWSLPSIQNIAQIIGIIILAGIAVRLLILALGILKLRQFRRVSSAISTLAESAAVLDEMRSRLDCRAEFRLSADVNSPVTFGFSAPVILLPENFTSMDSRFQTAIACHELLHVRRHDWAHHLAEEILRAALWFHPAIAWIIGRVRLTREQVVDLEVVRLTEARKPYLEALLAFTTGSARMAAIPAPPFLVERQLAERVALMLKEVRMSRTRLIASMTAIACCLALAMTLAVWTFPLHAAPRGPQNPPQSGVSQGVSGGVQGAVTGGMGGGVTQGVSSGVTGGVAGGVKASFPVKGSTQGVQGGVRGGVSGALVKRAFSSTAPAPQSQQENETTVRGTVLTPIRTVQAVYPADARAKRIEGTVVLVLTVNAEGKVSSMEVVSGPPELVQAVKDAAAQWAFPPPAKAPAVTTASFEFKLFPSSAVPSWSSTPMPNDGFDLKIFTTPGSKSETGSFYVGKVKTQTIYAPHPPYPPLARQMHISDGTVDLEVTMDTEGNVITVQLVKSTNPIFVQSAMDTVRTWKIKGTHDGVPVSFQMPVELKFIVF